MTPVQKQSSFLTAFIVCLGLSVAMPAHAQVEEPLPIPSQQEIQRLTDASAQGDLEKSMELADLYLKGHGVERNLQKAQELLRPVAEQNFSEAQYLLGVTYITPGIGGTLDLKRAKFWLNKAMLQGHEEAGIAMQLAKSFPDDAKLIPLNLLQKSADRGNINAQYNLSLRYRYGHGGVVKDEEAGLAMLEKVANQGHPNARYDLALIYLLEDEDKTRGMTLLTLAAEQNVADAQYLLARISYQGKEGFPKDPALGAEWMAKAAAQGHPEAVEYMAKLNHLTRWRRGQR